MSRIYLYAEAHAPKTVKEMGRYLARLVLLAKQGVEYQSVAMLKADLRIALKVITVRSNKNSPINNLNESECLNR